MASDALDLRGLLAELGPPTPGGSNGSFAVDPATAVGHIHLRVADLGDSERFYNAGLGFDVTQRSYPGALFLSAGGYHHHIGVNVWGSAGGSPAPAGSVGLRHYTVVLPDGGLDAFIDEITAAGLTPNRRGTAWWVKDPSGIVVALAGGSSDGERELETAAAATPWR
jgi:catechol 2,3-dioxygenase